MHIVTRVMGIVMAALAVQFVLNGITQFVLNGITAYYDSVTSCEAGPAAGILLD